MLFLFALMRSVSFFLVVTLFSSFSLSWAGEEDAFLAATVLQLETKWESVFEDFSQISFKKYCPRQFSEFQSVKLSYSHMAPRLHLSNFANLIAGSPVRTQDLSAVREYEAVMEQQQIESFMIELLQRCERKPEVIQLEYKFIEYASNYTHSVYQSLLSLFKNSELGLSFEEKKILAEKTIDARELIDFDAEKVLATIEGDLEDSSRINAEFLQKKQLTHEQSELEGMAALYGGSQQSPSPEKLSQSMQGVAQKKKGYCNLPSCKRKLPVMPFSCRCGGEFCSKHRDFVEHKCTFDYRAAGRALLEKANPKIVADKVKDRI
jgi:hypothetical protein